jgi:hypothetical protein
VYELALATDTEGNNLQKDPPLMTNPPMHLKQQKITYFFRRLPRSVQPNKTRQNCSPPKATPPPIAQKRNKSLQRHLLTYKKPHE